MMRRKYQIWFRYETPKTTPHVQMDTIFELTDREVEELTACLDDPFEFRLLNEKE